MSGTGGCSRSWRRRRILIISSGRYLRDWADGRAQEILQIRRSPLRRPAPMAAKSAVCRRQPDIAIISGSMRFPVPEVLTSGGRKVIIFTSANADPERVSAIESDSCRVVVAGNERVEGATLVQRMSEMGYKTIYSATGPKVLHLLLAGGVLNRLYLTLASRILGGQPYSSIVEGSLFEKGLDLRMDSLYFDSAALDGLGQMFIAYDRV